MYDSRRLFLVCAGLAYGLPLLIFALEGSLGLAVLALLAGTAWCLAELRIPGLKDPNLRHPIFSNLWFVLACGLALYLAFSGWSWWLALAVLTAALSAWDLAAFRLRLFPLSSPQGAGRLITYLEDASAGTPNTLVDADEDIFQWGAVYGVNAVTELNSPDTSGVEANGKQAAGQLAERMAIEKSHLRALSRVSGIGLGTAMIGYLVTNLLRFQSGLGLGLAFSLLLAVGLILLARSLVRP